MLNPKIVLLICAVGSEDAHGLHDLSSPRSHSSVDSRSSMASVATAPPSLPSFHHPAGLPLRYCTFLIVSLDVAQKRHEHTETL